MKEFVYIILFLTAFSWGSIYAQKVDPKGTFNVELTLPGSVSNAPFSDIMQGLANVSVLYQYSFPIHLNVGGGVRYSLFTVDEFAVPSPVYGNMQSGSVFLKLGYDKFHNDRFATDYGVKLGYTETLFSTDVNKEIGVNPVRVSGPGAEATIGLILTADERNSYRLIFGYGLQNFGFNPSMIGLESNEGYDPGEFDRITQYFCLGFGYTFYFGQKSSTD